tara:strand:- start:805 stop:1782 length:978 start_codon:yes stop_codon:yes gene_type:complete
MKLLNSKEIIDVFTLLLKIRFSEELLANKKKDKIILSPIHLSVGQEAIPIGIHRHFKKGDVVFGNHRSHHHILSLGTNLDKFFAEILCKSNGLSNGYGASMHLVDKKKGFFGSVPIVTGSLSLATGAAFALKVKDKNNIAIAYLGDGATEEGLFHESMLYSSKNKLPLLYVVENNEYSSNVHISLRHVKNDLTRFAKAHSINCLKVDGNDFFEINQKSKKIINTMRKDRTPFLIEAKTYRHYGHVDWREDIDVGIERSKSKLVYWKKKDPLIKIQLYMTKNNILNLDKITKLKNKINSLVNKSWDRALKYPDQIKTDLNKNIYHE